jgi:hypothetical protein
LMRLRGTKRQVSDHSASPEDFVLHQAGVSAQRTFRLVTIWPLAVLFSKTPLSQRQGDRPRDLQRPRVRLYSSQARAFPAGDVQHSNIEEVLFLGLRRRCPYHP